MRARDLPGETRGISAIVTFTILAALTMMAVSVYLRQQLPYDWKEEEFNTMVEVKNSFLELKEVILGLEQGRAGSVVLELGTISPTAYRGGATDAELVVQTSRDVSDATAAETSANVFEKWRAFDTYVKEADPTFNYQSPDYDNERLLVSTTEGNRIWSFLKFDLSNAEIYDDDDYVFHDDAQIHSAQLLLYVVEADLVESPSEKLEILPPLWLEVWGLENIGWGEGIDWNDAQQVHDPDLDMKLISDWAENLVIDGEGEWVAWDVTRYLKEKLEPFWGWGKWEQRSWWVQDALEVGKFSSGYSKYSNNTGAGTGSYLTGVGTVTSMVFDAGAVAYWNYVTYDNDGTTPTLTVYFDNDENPMVGGQSITVTPGDSPNVYARYVQYEVQLGAGDIFDNLVLEYTCHVAFLLREPYRDGTSYTSTLETLVQFNSGDNSVAEGKGFEPRIRIVFSRSGRLGQAREGVADFGYIKLKAHNEFFRPLNYCYEGGTVFTEAGWGGYQAILSYPAKLLTVTPTGEEIDGVKVAWLEVTRYQISACNVGGERAGASGATLVRVYPERIQWLEPPPAEPNRDEVSLTVTSTHPRIWSDVLQRIAAEVNYVLTGYESYDTYGPYTEFDYDTKTLTIRGDPGNGDPWTFKYSERVVWLDVAVGTYLGGRT